MRYGPAIALLAACGEFNSQGPVDGGVDDSFPGDAMAVCDTFIELDPQGPIASPTTVVRADARVLNAPGVVGYTWAVTFQSGQVATTFAAADESAIRFAAVTAGVYTVRLSVQAPVFCPDEVVDVNVLAPNANTTQVRLHATPATGAPPIDKLVPVSGGAGFSLGNVIVDPGVPVAAQVRQGTTGVAAFLRFTPVGTEAPVEAFSGAGGDVNVRVVNQVHDVLVIPASAGIAPQLIRQWTPGMPLALAGGTAVSGVVRTAGGAPIAGAKVQLSVDGVPSTLATTAGNGGFTVLLVPKTGATIVVDVTAPAATALPRLRASSVQLDLAQSIQIDYAAVVVRDLGGTIIRRGAPANPLANAKLVLVGTTGVPAGTVTAGAAVSSLGSFHIAATANGSGVLPATPVPARALAAVVEGAASSYSVHNVDFTSSVPATIDTAAPVGIATTIRDPSTQPAPGACVDIVPTGQLARAGAASTRVTANGSGLASSAIAAGGTYELRIHDPLRRGAPLTVPVSGGAVLPSYVLARRLLVTGKLVLPSTQPVGNTSVQILCALCSDFERDRPMAESTTNPGGSFTLVVPDPGTM